MTNNSNNITNDNSNNNDKLFFQIWRNIYILNQFIFHHLRLFNLLKNFKKAISYQDIDTYKSKYPLIYYCKSVNLTRLGGDMDHLARLIESLPENISSITINDLTFRKEFNQQCIGENIKSLTLNNQFNKAITVECIPVTLQKLKFGEYYDSPDFNLPLGSQLTYLSMGFSYDFPIKSGVLPITLKHLVLGREYNSKFEPQVLPPRLSILEFGSVYNHIIDTNMFQDPSSLNKLRFGRYYNQPLSTLNKFTNLKELYLGKEFDTSIEPEDLPFGLKVLQFNVLEGLFNKELKVGSLPESLEKIIFSLKFNQEIHQDNVSFLPPSLKVLKFGEHFSKSIPNGVLPDSIVKLYFDTEIQSPTNQESLSINQESLPISVEKLQISDRQQIKPNSIPSTVKFIRGVSSDQITQLSSFINHDIKLKTSYFFNQALLDNQTSISKSITSLSLGYSFNSPISLSNTSIRHLRFGHCFNKPLLENSLPSEHLESLEFGFDYNQPLNAELMKQLNKLKVLTFGNKYKIEIQASLLPNSITSLTLGQGYEYPISTEWLPKSIKRITALSNLIDIKLPLPFDQLESITIDSNNFTVFNNHNLVLDIFKYLKIKKLNRISTKLKLDNK